LGQWRALTVFPPFGAIILPTIRPSSIFIPDGSEEVLRPVATVVINIQSRENFGKASSYGKGFSSIIFQSDLDIFDLAVFDVF
jgi:hypothetical protein